MFYSHTHSQKGFTLVEILLVVFLIAILTTVAISSYINSADTFKFLSGYKQVMSAMRMTRSYAVSNKKQDFATPKYYGVCIAADRALVFADSGDKESQLDVAPDQVVNVGACNTLGNPVADAKYDFIISAKNFNFSGGKYAMEARDSNGLIINKIPLFLFYKTGTGTLSIFDSTNAMISKTEHEFISIRFYEKPGGAGDTQKFIKISQASGLAEELDEL